MAASVSSGILSWQGRGLKLETKGQVEELLKDVDPTTITEIHLGGNTIGVDASVAIAEFLSKTTQLKVADMADIFTGRLISEIPTALTALCDSLITKSTLVELNLSDNAFGGRSVDPLVPLLSQNLALQVLKLNNNGLGPAGGAVIANALKASADASKAKGTASNLRTVICGRNRLENGSAEAWAEAFAAHGTLEEVRMPQNGIWMDGITHLARGLKANANLRHIDLQDNTFTREGDDGQDGVKAWAQAVEAWKDLHTLNLSDCVLSNAGELPTLLEKLAEGSNPKLHTLSLQNNNLEAAALEVLLQSISEGLKSVQLLEIQWNEFDEDDENLESLSLSIKGRGGKVVVNDDDEEDEEEKEKEEEPEPEEQVPSKEDNDLAALLKKVTLKD